MTKEELLVELEKRGGPLDEKAKAAVNVALDLVQQPETPDTNQRSEAPTAGEQAITFQGENPPFDVAAGLSLDERSELMQKLTERNRAWLERTCRERQAGWLMVIDGQVMAQGATLENYPADEELLSLCQNTGKLPLLFIHDQLLAIEETTSWSPTVHAGDSYSNGTHCTPPDGRSFHGEPPLDSPRTTSATSVTSAWERLHWVRSFRQLMHRPRLTGKDRRMNDKAISPVPLI